jgi:tetratricopeptide (TPR) repeat protein
MKAFVTPPGGGARQWLLWIKRWDFNWQSVYEYVTPIQLARGSRITMEYTYDNSSGNRRNPNQPPQRVTYGPRSSDEMGDLWLQLLPAHSADRDRLVRDDRERTLAAAIAEAQLRVRRSPDAQNYNVLGALFITAGRLEDARVPLETAVRLRPSYAIALVNLGMVFQGQGRLPDAIAQFQAAVAADGGSFDAHFNLGTAFSGAGRFDEAAAELQRAIAIDERSAEAHNNLAVALGSLGKIADAIAHLERAVAIDPRYADAHSNLGFGLAQIGRRDEAIRHLRQALQINPRHPGALQHLRELGVQP